MTVKIKFKKNDCIGCGACAAICPSNWELKGGKASPKKLVLEKVDCSQDAADACPMNCIMILEQ